ncbi:MAG: leucyl aminopeptidase, partial [Acidobacteriota bacterium]
LIWHAPEGMPSPRYLLVGTGEKNDLDLECIRRICARATRRVMGTVRHLAISPPGRILRADREQLRQLQAMVEGVLLGGYRWEEYKSQQEKKLSRLKRITLLHPRSEAAQASITRGRLFARATLLARDLVCEPPSSMTPRKMAKVARRVARERGLSIQVHDEKKAGRMGMGCLLGVTRGSAEPPRVLHLTYRPRRLTARGKRKRVVLVGKGVTFDSGGLSLKPAASMETMKCDMAGAATVLGVLSALGELNCPLEVHGILMMTENMPSGSAYKPGDILHSMSGKTVEVVNTDAEGRLALADGLAYARTLKPDCIIDLATLTGAAVVALGTLCTGVMGYDRKLVQKLLDAAALTGEKLWPLPFYKEYRELLNSKVADIKQVGHRWGGALTAGLFLAEFVGRDIPWVHLDSAGPAYAEEDQPLSRAGGTGHPVRTMLQFLDSFD